MSIANALLNNLAMNLKNAQTKNINKAEKSQETENNQKAQTKPSFGGLTNLNVNLERNADADTLINNTREIYKNSIKASALLYVVGFALGFCPGLFFAATAAFLFSGRGLDFKAHLANSLSQNADVMAKFQSQNQNKETTNNTVIEADVAVAEEEKKSQPQQLTIETNQQPQLALETREQPLALETREQPLALETREQPQLALETQPRLALEMHDNNVTNPIVVQKQEQKQLSPLEIAQQKYAKALDSQNEAEALLEKREKAEQIAFEKYDEAKAKFDKAKAEYDQANAQMKAQMTEQMTNHQYSVMTRFTNANVAKEEADVAKAKLDQARVLTAIAQKEIEDLQAEDIVDIDI